MIIFLIFLVVVAGQAQEKYSMDNLQNASQEELNTYMNKALKLQKTGRTLNIIGGISYGTAVLTMILGSDWGFGVDSYSLIVIGGSGLILGTASFAVGIPANLTGKKRVERINNVKGTAFIKPVLN